MDRNGLVDNLGIPPLAGICTYEEAIRPGYSVDQTVDLLYRYNYTKIQLTKIAAAHLARTPEWEIKCGLSLHVWLDAEHSQWLRKRVQEMREPPHRLDEVPDERLEALYDELIRSEDSVELLTGIYLVVRREMIRSIDKHIAETNPLADHPTVRLLRMMRREEEEMLAWGTAALKALLTNEDRRLASKAWEEHLTAFLREAGGIAGDLKLEGELPAPRSDGKPYEMDPEPRRDARFREQYNGAGGYDAVYKDPEKPMVERVYALLWKRLREMDVPEWMAPIIYNTKGKPWQYYVDMSRQLWDEARHAMMGEAGLYDAGVPFYKYPVDVTMAATLNTRFKPIEAHLLLWAIEQSLMAADTGKRAEYEIAQQTELALAVTFQDYDWADEVLHAQIGRTWLVPEYGGRKNASKAAGDLWQRISATLPEFRSRSPQTPWWDDFMREVMENREKARAGKSA